jgi:hybrid cluster-associated redox disulfide protein
MSAATKPTFDIFRMGHRQRDPDRFRPIGAGSVRRHDGQSPWQRRRRFLGRACRAEGCAGATNLWVRAFMNVSQDGSRMRIDFDDIVGDVMTAWPVTIRAFLDFRMGCVGCPISGFHTVNDACREHGIDCGEFLAALRAAAAAAMA